MISQEVYGGTKEHTLVRSLLNAGNAGKAIAMIVIDENMKVCTLRRISFALTKKGCIRKSNMKSFAA